MRHLKIVLGFFSMVAITNSYAQIFKDVSAQVGLNYVYPGVDYQEVGAGICVLDVNNDGWDDFFQSGGVFSSKLWVNHKGFFIDETSKYGLDFLNNYFIQSVVAGDYDNDGFEDLFICNMGKAMNHGDHMPPVLLKNLNGKKFKPIHTETFNQAGSYPGAAWGDFNKDGYIDLYLLNYISIMGTLYDSIGDMNGYLPFCEPNLFYINKTAKGFTESAAEMNLNDKGCGLQVSFTDFDNDNDMDIMLLNDFGSWNNIGNKLYRNDFPELSFTDISDSTGFYNEFYGMGIGIGDYDNNGYLDYYLTNIGRNFFYKNTGQTIEELGRALNIDLSMVNDTLTGTSWSGIFFDLENDTDLDLFVSKGYLNSLEKVVVKDENVLFENIGQGLFNEISAGSGINDSLANRGAATLDYDHDGDLDVITSVIKLQRGELGGLDQKIKLFENQNNQNNNWIGIKLVGGLGVNKSCLGCSVSFNQNGLTQIREVDGSSGHNCQSSRILYFGLGKATEIENIAIEWLGSPASSVKQLNANHVYRIDVNGKIKILY